MLSAPTLLRSLTLTHMDTSSFANRFSHRRLGELSVSSPKLSDESYDEAVALSSGFARLAEFTAAAGDRALGDMLKALKDLSPTRLSRAELSQGSGAHHAPSRPRAAQHQQHQQDGGGGGGFGSRLLGLARNTLQNLSQQPVVQRQRLHPGRKFGDDLRERAYSRGGRAEGVGFGLVLMVDIARVNEWRGEICGR